MIYYFSGTGNSKWVAEVLAEKLQDEAVDIASLSADGPTSIYVGEQAKIGFVFPVYAWGVPEIMMNFIKNIRLRSDSYCFAICTCGGEAGHTLSHLSKKIKLDSGYSIVMPNNYIIGKDVDTHAVAAEKISHAKEKLEVISQDILIGSKTIAAHTGSLALVKSYLVSPLFNQFARGTKPFFADISCNGCGLCQRICPAHTIRMKDNKPKWGVSCTQCLGCINRCPQKAIQYGDKTQKRGRYYLEVKDYD